MPAARMSAKDLLRVRASRTEELGEIRPDTLLPIARRMEDIWLIVAGGPRHPLRLRTLLRKFDRGHSRVRRNAPTVSAA